MVNMVERVLLLAAAAALLACGESSTLEIRPRGSLSDSTELAGLHLSIRGRSITAHDFGPDEAGLTEFKLTVPNSGRIDIGVRLDQYGRLAAEGNVSWELAPEFEWGLDIFRTTSDPMDMCLGCAGSVEIPIQAWAANEPRESLWFAWGGKPKGSDIVF
jgi:hypothetical protein